MKLFGLKNCDTCRKALKILEDVDFVDVRAEGVPVEVLQEAYEFFGEALLNKRSTTWRNLSESERAEPPIALLQAQPTLMKRPLIVDDAQLWLGWGKDVQAELT